MASTGFTLAGTGANNADAGNNAWTSPGNITATDNADATTGVIAVNNTSQYLHGTNFGFATGDLVPSGATIDGIEVRVERAQTSGGLCNIRDQTIQLIKGGTRQGDNNADTGTNWPTTDTNKDYGGAANLWSLTLSAADVRAADFGVAVRVSAVGTDDDATAFVDAVWINVHYTESTPTAALTGSAVPTITEAEVVTGGETIVITLTNDTWLTVGVLFDAIRQDIIDGLDSNGSETNGWNTEVRDKQGVAGVVRTSDTVVTITLDAQAGYNISLPSETITVTVPITATTLALDPIVATPTFDVAYTWPPAGAAAETLHQVRSGLIW